MRGKTESTLNLRAIYNALFHPGVNLFRSLQKSLISFTRKKRGKFNLDLIYPILKDRGIISTRSEIYAFRN